MELAMRDEQRARLGIPALDQITTPRDPVWHASPHWHVWIEKGWSGTLSPAYPNPHAAGRALQRLSEEDWCSGLSGSSYFPFTQMFLKTKELDGDGHIKHLNVTLNSCDGKTLDSGSHMPCNQTRSWR